MRRFGTAIPAVLILLAFGCVDLSGVQRFAETSARTADYTALVDAYVESPGLMKRFAPGQSEIWDKESKARERQRAGLLALHEGIEQYMVALANLAADEAVDFSSDFEALGKALGDAGVEEAPREAVQTVGALVARAASDGYRRRQVREVIQQGDPPLQDIISKLRQIVKSIAEEASDLDKAVSNFYASRIREAQDRGASGVETILGGWEYREREEIDAIAKASADYGRALDKIAAAHAELAASLDEIDSEELQQQMKFYAKEIRNAAKTLQKL